MRWNLPESEILIADEFDEIKRRFEEEFEAHRLRIFQREEFKVEDAKEVIKEAYISTKEPKILLLVANRYNIYAQNALLKILEEPPKNVVFILCARSKSTFLPTVLSRLPVKKIGYRAAEEEELEDFDLATLYELAKEPKMEKARAKALLKGFLRYAIKRGYRLHRRELDYFAKALELIELNSNPSNVLITAGLIILRHKKRGR